MHFKHVKHFILIILCFLKIRPGTNYQSDLVFTLIFSSIQDVTANLGMTYLQQTNPYMQQRTIIKTINHPRYNSVTKNHDIALLQLSAPVTFTSYVMPACLAAASSDFPPKTKVWVTGWGDIRSDGECSTTGELHF